MTGLGDWVFIGGFGATDFAGDWMSERHMGETGMVAPDARVNPYVWLGEEIEKQMDYTLERLQMFAEKSGTSLNRCVKADINLTHPSDYYGMDKVWRKWFPDNLPARTVNTGLRLVVKGVRAEIAPVLLAGDSAIPKETVETSDAPEPIGHPPQAVRASDPVYFSHQLPVDSAGRVPKELRFDPNLRYYREPARAQQEAIFGNVAAIAEAAGSSLDNVCKVQSAYADLGDLPQTARAWASVFASAPPAFTALGVGRGRGRDPLLVPHARLQMDVIGYRPADQTSQRTDR